MQSGTAGITWRAFAQPWGDDPRVCAAAFRELMPEGVDKSSSHHLSQTEIGGENPCSQHLSGNPLVSEYAVKQACAGASESSPRGSEYDVTASTLVQSSLVIFFWRVGTLVSWKAAMDLASARKERASARVITWATLFYPKRW